MYLNIKQLTISFLSTLTLTSTIFAQAVNLTGKVVDQFGAPVVNAKLRLKKSNYSTHSITGGLFTIDGSTTGSSVTSPLKSHKVPGFTPDYLQLGNYFNVSISVFSVRGALLNRLIVTNQNKVSISTLIPTNIRSQALIISIKTSNGTFSLRAVRCSSQWLINNEALIKASLKASGNRTAETAPIDVIIVEHESMQTVAVPIQSLVAVLPDIVLNYIVEPVTPTGNGTIIGDVAIAPLSTTFKSEITATLSSTLPGVEIRYTTDGTLPTTESTLYSGDGIVLTGTTQLRAAAFSESVQKGEPSTAIFIARTFEYTSDIPIIVMEGYGVGAPKDKYNFIDMGFMTFEPVNGVASFENGPTLATRAGYHLRGQSSMMMFEQAPYRIELWDNYDEDADYPVLGMPADADWALISPCTDNSLIRNVFMYDMGKAIGLETVKYRFAEIFINQDGGPLEASDYQGIYTIMQPIKNRKNILDLKKLRPEDTSPDKLSGGYIVRFDQMVNDSGMIKLECVGSEKMGMGGFGGFGGNRRRIDSTDTNTATCFADLELVSPSEPNKQQLDWITAYIQEFHDALHADPIGDWKKYIDFNSFVNIHIINEISRDVDAWIRSHFMHKERNKPLTAGPLWDYNFALGNFSADLEGWHCEENRRGSNDWHLLMWQQPEFKAAFKNRYLELRASVLSDDGIDLLVDNLCTPLRNVAQRNFTAYPMGDCQKEGRGFGGGGNFDFGDFDFGDFGDFGNRDDRTEDDDNNVLKKAAFFGRAEITDSTWTGQVDSLKTWTKKRLHNLDSSVTTLP